MSYRISDYSYIIAYFKTYISDVIFLNAILYSLITYRNKLTIKCFCEKKLINTTKGTKFKRWFDLSYDVIESSGVINYCFIKNHATIKYEWYHSMPWHHLSFYIKFMYHLYLAPLKMLMSHLDLFWWLPSMGNRFLFLSKERLWLGIL